MNTQKLLDHLQEAEKHIDRVQRTFGVKQEYPKAWDILEQIRGLLNAAHIKLNFGDDKS